MNTVPTADKNLCRKLHSLSGWRDCPMFARTPYEVRNLVYPPPAYNAGYLLRKLPPDIDEGFTTYYIQISRSLGGNWQADYREENDGQYTAEVAGTPEDALAKLAIALFEAGVLKKEAS